MCVFLHIPPTQMRNCGGQQYIRLYSIYTSMYDGKIYYHSNGGASKKIHASIHPSMILHIGVYIYIYIHWMLYMMEYTCTTPSNVCVLCPNRMACATTYAQARPRDVAYRNRWLEKSSLVHKTAHIESSSDPDFWGIGPVLFRFSN